MPDKRGMTELVSFDILAVTKQPNVTNTQFPSSVAFP